MNDASRDLTPATIEQVAALFGVPLPPDTHAHLLRVMAVLLESARLLDSIDLDGSEPAAVFDPRWED